MRDGKAAYIQFLLRRDTGRMPIVERESYCTEPRFDSLRQYNHTTDCILAGAECRLKLCGQGTRFSYIW